MPVTDLSERVERLEAAIIRSLDIDLTEFDGLLAQTPDEADPVQVFQSSSAQELRVAIGKTAAPSTIAQPTMKVERIMEVNSADYAGDGVERLSAILAIASGTVNNAGQPVGVAGFAKTVSTSQVTTGADDACGVYGVGRIEGAGTGTGAGGFLHGRRDTDTGRALGAELHCGNQTATPGVYNSTGFSNTMGLWINAGGLAASGAGIVIGQGFGRQFEVGLAFNAQVTGGFTGGVANQSIRDDGNAATSILINGVHATAAFAVAGVASNNGVLIGGVASLTSGAARLEVHGQSTFQDPLVYIGSTSQSQAYKVLLRNSSGTGFWGVSGSTDGLLTGTVAGDQVLTASTSGKSLHLGGTTSTVEVTQANALGFYNATPVAKQTGVAVSAAGIHAALVSLGLIAA